MMLDANFRVLYKCISKSLCNYLNFEQTKNLNNFKIGILIYFDFKYDVCFCIYVSVSKDSFNWAV